MAFDVSEDFESRTPMVVGDNSDGQTRVYTIRNCIVDDNTEPNIISAVTGFAPAVIPGLAVTLILKTVNISERLGPTSWRAVAEYGRSEATAGSVSFDTSGGTAHITQSISTVASYAAPGVVAPDFGGTIGVTENAIEGVDVTRPKFSFQQQIQVATLSESYLKTIFLMTGTVNALPWKIYAAGEVLFLGATGSQTGTEPVDLTFRFEASPNATGLSVGNITGITKDGWDYLWVRHYEVSDATSQTMVKIPLAVYVERVYPRTNFDALGL